MTTVESSHSPLDDDGSISNKERYNGSGYDPQKLYEVSDIEPEESDYESTIPPSSCTGKTKTASMGTTRNSDHHTAISAVTEDPLEALHDPSKYPEGVFTPPNPDANTIATSVALAAATKVNAGSRTIVDIPARKEKKRVGFSFSPSIGGDTESSCVASEALSAFTDEPAKRRAASTTEADRPYGRTLKDLASSAWTGLTEGATRFRDILRGTSPITGTTAATAKSTTPYLGWARSRMLTFSQARKYTVDTADSVWRRAASAWNDPKGAFSYLRKRSQDAVKKVWSMVSAATPSHLSSWRENVASTYQSKIGPGLTTGLSRASLWGHEVLAYPRIKSGAESVRSGFSQATATAQKYVPAMSRWLVAPADATNAGHPGKKTD